LRKAYWGEHIVPRAKKWQENGEMNVWAQRKAESILSL